MSGPVLFERTKQQFFEFNDVTEFTIGRSPTCSINIVETSISRCQCTIKKVPEGEWLIQDKSSFKSTLLNGNKIPQSGQYLKSLDLITFNTQQGSTSWQLVFYESKDDVPPSAKRRRLNVDENLQVASQESRCSIQSAKPPVETSSTTDTKYKQKCQMLTEELQAVSNEKKALETEVKRLQEEKDRVDDILIGSHLDSKQLLEHLEDCRSEVVRLAQERDELQEELQETLKKKDAADAAANPLGSHSQSSTSELESNLIMKTIEVEELKDELQEAKSKLEKLEELVQSLSSQNEKVYNDAVAVLEQEFLCCVCSDLLYEPVTLNCRHTMCRDCLKEWKKKKKECPSCRTKIKTEVSPLMVDTFIDRIAPLLGEEFLKRREESKRERTAPKTPPRPPPAPAYNAPRAAAGAGSSRGGGRGRGRNRGRRTNNYNQVPYLPPTLPAPHLVPGVIDLTDRGSLQPPREPNNAAGTDDSFSESDDETFFDEYGSDSNDSGSIPRFLRFAVDGGFDDEELDDSYTDEDEDVDSDGAEDEDVDDEE